MTGEAKPQGIGASVLRREDDRLLRGRGQFVGDIRLAGMKDVAFVRSPLAHARVRAVHVPEVEKGRRIFAAGDLDGVKPIVAITALAGFKVSEQPVLAFDKVRQVGELVAMCVAVTSQRVMDPRIMVSLWKVLLLRLLATLLLRQWLVLMVSMPITTA